MPVPLSPEEEAAVAAYYGGVPGATMSSAASLPMSTDPNASYWGAAPAPDPGVRQPTSFSREEQIPVAAVPPPPPPPGPPPTAFQPNPGAPNYQPNPNAKAKAPIPAPADVTPADEAKLSAYFSVFGEKLPIGDLAAPAEAPVARDPVAFTRDAPAAPPARGAGGAPNLDPYGINAANARVLGAYDTQAGAVRRTGQLESGKAEMLGLHHAEMARRMEEDSAIMRAEQDYAAQQESSSIEELSRQIDDVRAKKIQPLSVMDASGLGPFAIIAAALAGFGQGLTHGKENSFLAEVNRVIDRQVAADEKNLDNEKAGLSSKMSLLQQQRLIHHDLATAKDAARNLYYEAFKENIAGEAQQYDSPIYSANADKAIGEINLAQAQVQRQLAEAKRAQAAAMAAQQFARTKEVRDARNAIYDKVLAHAVTAGEPIERATAIAEAESNRQIGATYAPGSVPQRGVPEASMIGGTLGKTGREKVALDRYETQGELNANLTAIEHAKRDLPHIIAGTSLGALGAELPTWVPLVEGARKNVNARDAYNVQVKISVGAAYKLGTSANEPKNREMVEKLAAPYTIQPSDNAAIARQRMDGLQKLLIENSAAKGAAPAAGARPLDLKPFGG